MGVLKFFAFYQVTKVTTAVKTRGKKLEENFSDKGRPETYLYHAQINYSGSKPWREENSIYYSKDKPKINVRPEDVCKYEHLDSAIYPGIFD